MACQAVLDLGTCQATAASADSVACKLEHRTQTMCDLHMTAEQACMLQMAHAKWVNVQL